MITADDAGFHLHTTNDSNLTTTASKISHHALGQNNFQIYIYLSVCIVSSINLLLCQSIYCSFCHSFYRPIVQSFFLSLVLSLVVGYSIICFITLSISWIAWFITNFITLPLYHSIYLCVVHSIISSVVVFSIVLSIYDSLILSIALSFWWSLGCLSICQLFYLNVNIYLSMRDRALDAVFVSVYMYDWALLSRPELHPPRPHQRERNALIYSFISLSLCVTSRCANAVSVMT